MTMKLSVGMGTLFLGAVLAGCGGSRDSGSGSSKAGDKKPSVKQFTSAKVFDSTGTADLARLYLDFDATEEGAVENKSNYDMTVSLRGTIALYADAKLYEPRSQSYADFATVKASKDRTGNLSEFQNFSLSGPWRKVDVDKLSDLKNPEAWAVYDSSTHQLYSRNLIYLLQTGASLSNCFKVQFLDLRHNGKPPFQFVMWSEKVNCPTNLNNA